MSRDDQRVWIVCNVGEPVASHPTLQSRLALLIQGYDLSSRIRPTIDQRPKANPLKALRGRR